MVSASHLTAQYSEHAREMARRYQLVARRNPVTQAGLEKGGTRSQEPSKKRAAAHSTKAARAQLDILA